DKSVWVVFIDVKFVIALQSYVRVIRVLVKMRRCVLDKKTASPFGVPLDFDGLVKLIQTLKRADDVLGRCGRFWKRREVRKTRFEGGKVHVSRVGIADKCSNIMTIVVDV